ncbi:hypothetical protein BGZ99_000206 [Dissophora globulifera]|uniref:Ion transport domain-containing protein n=1 Tax=Dissophora globulifera TaxID=979702 RepID=A0A9P6RUK9_9FUNG|nr:hypothetical protein BGZ99_000206 [Dissophora globulifera]
MSDFPGEKASVDGSAFDASSVSSQEILELGVAEPDRGDTKVDSDYNNNNTGGEKLTQQILNWRSKMEATKPPPHAIRRWYMEDGDSGVMDSTERPTKPITVGPEQFSVDLHLDGIDAGAYELVLCVSLNSANANALEELWFMAQRKGVDDLYGGIDVEPTEPNVLLTIGVDAGEIDFTFELHYIELQSNLVKSTPRDNERVIYGDGKPDQIIAVGRVEEPSKKSTSIRAFDISDNGDHAATIYVADGLAHVDVWDLRAMGQRTSLAQPQLYNVASSRSVFAVPPSLERTIENPVPISINISSSGAQVAVCTDGDADDCGIPFLVLKTAPAAPADKNLSDPWRLVKSKTVCDGSHFHLISFYKSGGLNHSHDYGDDDDDCERFWTCDATSFTFYSIKNNWSRIYTLSMQGMGLQTAKNALTSIHGRYFAWTGVQGIISIWEYETGNLVSRIHTGREDLMYPSLSMDGSMVAFSCRGSIQIRDTFSGIPLAILNEGLNSENQYEVIFGQEHFMVRLGSDSSSSRLSDNQRRGIVRVSDAVLLKTEYIYEDYRFHYPQSNYDPVFAYLQGSNLNVMKLGALLTPSHLNECGVGENCVRAPLELEVLHQECSNIFKNAAEFSFNVMADCNLVRDVTSSCIKITALDGSGKSTKQMITIPFGDYFIEKHAVFLPMTSQLALVSNGYLQLWNLSSEKKPSSRFCELALIVKYEKLPDNIKPVYFCDRSVISARACVHGKRILIRLSPAELHRLDVQEADNLEGDSEVVLTLPKSPEDTLASTDDYRMAQGYIKLIDIYVDGDDAVKQVVLKYLKTHIRLTSEILVSSLTTLCSAWTQELSSTLEAMISDMLPHDRITWAPDVNVTKTQDPLAIILEKAKLYSKALPVVQILMDYCVHHAYRSHNLAFMSPLFGNLRDFMESYPEEAQTLLDRIAFIPVLERSHILNNHILIYSPSFRFHFWKPRMTPLCDIEDPILQLHFSSSPPDPRNDRFTLPVFMASFDVLWSYREGRLSIGSSSDAMAEASNTLKLSWWRTLYYAIRLKSRLRMESYVECYDFDLEFFENPAVAALVAYKWSTIGFWYWFVRFIFQCCLYAMIIIASIMQVYYPAPSKLAGLFIAIIAMSAIFLWLEMLQAVRGYSRYAGSAYNKLDVITFCLTMVAGVDQLVLICKNDTHGNTRLLSYSLFELRINKMVCKYVTIMKDVVSEIKVFFIIFAGGTLAFAIAVLHLLRACPYEGCDGPTTSFSGNFLGALFQTYFFMGGRWDPVSDEFATQDWGFQLMMALFFFFTVILMLNVLIGKLNCKLLRSLINVAFVRGDESWRLVWIESRLRYIESAENMSYHIPGFRQTYNWFPKEIYFTADPKQVKKFRKTHPANGKGDDDTDRTEDMMCSTPDVLDYFYDNHSAVEALEDDNEEENKTRELEESAEGEEQHSDTDDDENEDEDDEKEDEDDEDDDGGSDDDKEESESSKKQNERGEKNKRESGLLPDDESISKGNRDAAIIKQLSSQVEEIKAQLQQQLADQLIAQQEQARQQFEELRKLLLGRDV